MCILQSFVKPTGEGVWWRDDTKWCLYSPQTQQTIRKSIANKLKQIDLGMIKSSVHPKGARYTLSLEKMEQVAVQSGQRRPVMVIDPAKVTTLQLEEPPQSTLLPGGSSTNFSRHVHYTDTSGNMQRYDDDIAKALLQAMAFGTQHTLLVPDGRSGGHLYFNLEEMKQYFVEHLVHSEPFLSKKSPLKVVVEIPWDPTAMASIAVKADKQMRRKILVMVIQRYRSDDLLDTILPIKAKPRTYVSKDTSSTCGPGNPLYESFVDSLETELEACPKEVFGAIVKQTGMNEISGGPIQMAFKPAKRLMSARAPSMLKDANGDEVNSKTAFWTSMAAPLAAAHAVVYGCAAQLKVLLYLIIVPTWEQYASICNRERCSGYVQVYKPEHRLHLAEVIVN